MIKLIKSTFYKEEEAKKELCNFIAVAQQLSFGSRCEEFEKNFANYQGRKYCIFFNSGSSANLAIVQTLLNIGKIKRGEKVGFSAVTWSTNVMPLIELGLRVSPIDIELETLNLSSRTLVKFLKNDNQEIKMLFLTNLLGFCSDIDEIKKICDEKGIILVEDNCESLGTVYRGKKLGNFGVASTFSFYVGHHLSTIEGGAVCTDDYEIAVMLKLVRAHGWDRNLRKEEQNKIRVDFGVDSSFYASYTFYDLGYNLRPTEINGFIGNWQLQYIEEIVQKRRDNFMKVALPIYRQTTKYYPIQYSHIDFLSNFAIPVVCRSREIRDTLVKRCEGKIEIRPIVGGNMIQQPFYRKYLDGNINEYFFPNATIAHEQGLYFGNNPEMVEKEMSEIVKVFTG